MQLQNQWKNLMEVVGGGDRFLGFLTKKENFLGFLQFQMDLNNTSLKRLSKKLSKAKFLQF